MYLSFPKNKILTTKCSACSKWSAANLFYWINCLRPYIDTLSSLYRSVITFGWLVCPWEEKRKKEERFARAPRAYLSPSERFFGVISPSREQFSKPKSLSATLTKDHLSICEMFVLVQPSVVCLALILNGSTSYFRQSVVNQETSLSRGNIFSTPAFTVFLKCSHV